MMNTIFNDTPMHSTNSEWDRFSIKLFSDKCFISRKCRFIHFSLLKSWRYPVGWIVFSLPKSSRYPWRPCSWNPKKKFCGWRRKKRCSARLLQEGYRSWSDHDLRDQIMIWSWSGSPNTSEKRTSRDQHGDLVIRSWSDHDLDHEDRSSWLQSAEIPCLLARN